MAPMSVRSTATPSASEVHVVVAADREHWAGVIGVVNSVRRNCATPARLRLHVVVTAGTEGAFGAFLRCHGVERDGLRVVGFSAKRLPKIKVRTLLTNLESPLNFARFYLHELLPGVPKAPALPVPSRPRAKRSQVAARPVRRCSTSTRTWSCRGTWRSSPI